MLDIWGFLLQTLTVSGVAALLLVIKALFKDKLPPKWHFAVWGVLGLMLLLPAGANGRYTLFHWQPVVELIKLWAGEHSVTQVLFPIPILTAMPKTVAQWIFAGYILGVAAYIIKYLVSYIRLRLVLRKGIAPCGGVTERIQRIATEQKVGVRRVTAVPGLPSAFVCGILRPVLVLPADSDIDDKVILHELLHMKYRDTLWSVVICFWRCLHWCNPLVVYCANRAINDMEARCDQYVLERLEGEERRDYGRILLSMANDRFAKTPGSTCVNNGGSNIRQRIETIARFKKYPVGMELVSACALILLTVSLAVGVQASEVYDSNGSVWLSFASARSTPCTTPAGAFDTYAKAVLDQNGFYRAMCAPGRMQEEILTEILEKEKAGTFPYWDCGLEGWADTQSGYYIYNLNESGDNACEGLLVIKLTAPTKGEAELGKMYLAVQKLRVEKENGRWVAVPLEAFRYVEAVQQSLGWGCAELPGVVYSGTAAKLRVDVKVQTVYTVDSTVQHNSSPLFGYTTSCFDTTPKPNARFTQATMSYRRSLIHLGTAEERDRIGELGLSIAPVYAGETRPEHLMVPSGSSISSSSTGECWSSQQTKPGWGPALEMSGGGTSFASEGDAELPEYYAAELYINGTLAAQLDLCLQEVEE